jgi:hypothetical protein
MKTKTQQIALYHAQRERSESLIGIFCAALILPAAVLSLIVMFAAL